MNPSGEAPLRLRHRRGQWALETHDLVAVDRDVFRTMKRSVVGPDAILSHLKRHAPDPALRDATIQLFKARRDEDATYEWVDGEWTSGEAAEATTKEPQSHVLNALIKELSAELLVLRASHRTLKERVRGVERRVRESGLAAVAAPGAPGPSEASMRPVQGPSLAPEPETPGAEDVAPYERDPDLPQLVLPSVPAVLASLKQLLAAEPLLRHDAEARPPSKAELARASVSWLRDARSRVLGAIVVNAAAVAELGGALLGLTPAAIAELSASGEISEDGAAAMNEICKCLAAAVNRAGGDAEIVTEPLGSASEDELRWLPHATKSAVLASSSGAKLAIFAR